MKSPPVCAKLHTSRMIRIFLRQLRVLLAAALCSCAALAADKVPADRVDAALAEAERFAKAGQWREALTAGDKLRAACREARGEIHADTAFAELFLGEARDHLGQRNLAEAHFRRALAIQEQVLAPQSPELVATLTRLGAVLKAQQRSGEAVAFLQRALELQTRLTGESLETADASTNLARALRANRTGSEAVPLLERALRIRREKLGGTAPETLSGLEELARLQEANGNFAAAEMAAAEWRVGAEAQYGSQSAELCAALGEWARCAEAQAHFADAEGRSRQGLAIAETSLAEDRPLIATLAAQLGSCLQNLGRPDDAKPLLLRSLQLRIEALGPGHPDTAASHRLLGAFLRDARDLAGAQQHFQAALEIYERAAGRNDPTTLESLGDFAEVVWLAGDTAKATALYEDRRARVGKSLGSDSAEAAGAEHALALVYESAQRWPQAVEAALRSLHITEKLSGLAAAETLGELSLLSRLCLAAGTPAPALTELARISQWLAAYPDSAPQARAKVERDYAIATLRAGHAEDAEPLFRESQRLHVAAFGPAHPESLRSGTDLWTFYAETRQPARAVEVARTLAEGTERELGANSPAAAEIWKRFGQLQLTLGDRAAAMLAFRHSVQIAAGAPATERLANLAQIAGSFEEVRDFAHAAEMRRDHLALLRQTLSFGSAEEGAACGQLGLDYLRVRDFLPARGMFEHSRELAERRGPTGATDALIATARLGDVALAAGDLPAALRERQRLAAGCAQQYGAGHPEHGRALLLLGEVQLQQQSLTAAGQSLDEAARVLGAARADDPLLARVAADRATLALQQGREEDARAFTRRALAASMPHDEAMAEALAQLGDAWLVARDLLAGERVLDAALAILAQVAGDQNEHTIALLERVAKLRLQNGHRGAAELLERALAAAGTLYGSGSPEAAGLPGWLTLALLADDRESEARASAQRWLASADDSHRELAQALAAWVEFRRGGGAIEPVAEYWQRRFGWFARAFQ